MEVEAGGDGEGGAVCGTDVNVGKLDGGGLEGDFDLGGLVLLEFEGDEGVEVAEVTDTDGTFANAESVEGEGSGLAGDGSEGAGFEADGGS